MACTKRATYSKSNLGRGTNRLYCRTSKYTIRKYIIYQKATDLPHVSYHILKEYTKGEVPLLLRVSVFMIGAFVLYKRELFDIEKRLYQNDKRIHVS